MSRIYLIRHCEATGQEMDAALTSQGQDQSYELESLLKDKGVEWIVSSHFLRAQQSVLPLSKTLKLPITIDKRLGERILSSKNMPDWFEALRKTYEDPNLKYEGGESALEATARALRCLHFILEQGKETIAVVTHGGLLSLLLKHYDHRYNFETWKALTNPDVYCFTYTGETTPKIERLWGKRDGSIA